MSAVANNRMYVYNKIKTHTLVILMHAKMCIYIYTCLSFYQKYTLLYIYIYHSISCLSNSRILIADISCFIHPYLNHVSRVGGPLHVPRASQINAAPVFSPSGLSPKNMEVLGSWEPWDKNHASAGISYE